MGDLVQGLEVGLAWGLVVDLEEELGELLLLEGLDHEVDLLPMFRVTHKLTC